MVKPMPTDIIRNISGIDTETAATAAGAEPADPEGVDQLIGDLQDVAAHDRKGEQEQRARDRPFQQARVESAAAEAGASRLAQIGGVLRPLAGLCRES